MTTTANHIVVVFLELVFAGHPANTTAEKVIPLLIVCLVLMVASSDFHFPPSSLASPTHRKFSPNCGCVSKDNHCSKDEFRIFRCIRSNFLCASFSPPFATFKERLIFQSPTQINPNRWKNIPLFFGI